MYTSSIVVLSDRRRSLARHSQYPRLLRLPLYPPCPTVRFVGVVFVCWLVRLWRSSGGGKARATTIEFQEWPIRIANRSALLLFRCCCCNVAFSRHVGTRYAHPPETGQHLLCHHCCGCGWFCISKCASGLRATPVVIASSPKIQLFVVSMLWEVGGWRWLNFTVMVTVEEYRNYVVWRIINFVHESRSLVLLLSSGRTYHTAGELPNRW